MTRSLLCTMLIALMACWITSTAAGQQCALIAGDANQDLFFDHRDLQQVMTAGKYRTGELGIWGEGDWNMGGLGTVGSPPSGDGVFDELDILLASNEAWFETVFEADQCRDTRPPNQVLFWAVKRREEVDEFVAGFVVYDAQTGELRFDPPPAVEFTSLDLRSSSGIFAGDAGRNLDGVFDVNDKSEILKTGFGQPFSDSTSYGRVSFGSIVTATFGGSFGSSASATLPSQDCPRDSWPTI